MNVRLFQTCVDGRPDDSLNEAADGEVPDLCCDSWDCDGERCEEHAEADDEFVEENQSGTEGSEKIIEFTL